MIIKSILREQITILLTEAGLLSIIIIQRGKIKKTLPVLAKATANEVWQYLIGGWADWGYRRHTA